MRTLPLLSTVKLSSLFYTALNTSTDLWSRYQNNFKSDDFLVFDKETKLLTADQNIYSHIPEFVLGSMVVGRHDAYTIDILGMFFAHIVNNSRDMGATLVGHNICFDLNPITFDDHVPFIWDTALAHYMMTGQKDSFPSLEDVAKYYGIEGKENAVSEMIKSGVCPSVIPAIQLSEYCEQDVKVTRNIYMRQMGRLMSLKDQRLPKLICQMMQWLWWTHKASSNGIVVNRIGLSNILPSLQADIEAIEQSVYKYMESVLSTMSRVYMDWCPKSEFSVSSPKQIATMIFGGDFEGYIMVDTGARYKTGTKAGTIKTRREDLSIHVPGIPGAHRFKKGTDEKNLLAILGGLPMSSDETDYITNVLKYRDLSKTVNTYLQSYLEKSSFTGAIHPQYKHVGTPTGRLSCTNPNIQNLKGE